MRFSRTIRLQAGVRIRLEFIESCGGDITMQYSVADTVSSRVTVAQLKKIESAARDMRKKMEEVRDGK